MEKEYATVEPALDPPVSVAPLVSVRAADPLTGVLVDELAVGAATPAKVFPETVAVFTIGVAASTSAWVTV